MGQPKATMTARSGSYCCREGQHRIPTTGRLSGHNLGATRTDVSKVSMMSKTKRHVKTMLSLQDTNITSTVRRMATSNAIQ